MNVIYLSLGSNKGDSENYLERALDELKKENLKLLALSRLYLTKAVGYTEQRDFLNMAVKIETELSARELLDRIHIIEKNLGRERVIRWGPRTIDIDIIWQEGEIIVEDDLTVPHPHAFGRAFVVLPMLDLPITDKLLKSRLEKAKEITKDQEISLYI